MKLLTALLCAILFAVVGTTTEAQAQQYLVTNNTPVSVFVCVHTNCGVFGPFAVPAGAVNFPLPVPVPPCIVSAISYSTVPGGQCPLGPLYGVGFNGPVPPPNPPNFLQVNPGNAVFW